MRGSIESAFLRPLYLGESVAPYLLLKPAEAIIPWTGKDRLLDAKAAEELGYADLAAWLKRAEALWTREGKSNFSLAQRLDYHRELSAQLPPPKLRVLYAASGTLPAATFLRDNRAVVEHKLYWASVASEDEARYLEAVTNSEALRSRVARKQSRGQWGARDFDKVLVEEIPKFDPANPLHADLIKGAEHAEKVAQSVELPENIHFVRARQKIREALREDGVAQRIDALVGRLL